VSAQEQISKLQGLLQRIQKNASRPRGGSSAAAPIRTAPFGTEPLASAPVPFAAPSPFAVPAPPSFDPVDELLGVSPEPSPLPVDIDVPLDSVPPVAETAVSEAPEAEPIPLVSVSAGQAAPPPIDEAFALESEVSEVRVAPITREPATEVTVEAIAAEAEPIAAEELSEDDLVEVTEGTPPPAATDVDIDFEDEEQPPASSQRSRVASSMDEALAAAAEQIDAEREVPLKTPPPESGPQAAPLPMGMAAPAAPDVDALLGGELDIPTRADTGMTSGHGPTPEQLGQTIDLDEARGPSLELAEQKAIDAPAPIEELEAPLPGPTLVGGYDENLQPPPEAREELEAHLRRQEDDIAPPPESLAQYPSVQPNAPAPEIVPVYEAAPAGPEVLARPIPMGSPESFGSVRESFRPSSFVELLDASLSLNAE
jgi:hypothetical protein